jgi:hypothetical protein
MATAHEIAQARLAICRACKEWAGQCRLGHDPLSLAGCPLGKFCGYRGLGNAVARVAKPLAQAVGLRHCPSCDSRQDKMNHWIRR